MEVNFAFDQFTLSELEKSRLDSFIQTHTPIERIELSGHTDERGGVDYNIELSRKRIESVRTYLLNKGINDRLIDAAYFGESLPKATNEDEAGRQKNRRVELLLKFKIEEEVTEAEEIIPPNPILITKTEEETALIGDTLLLVDEAQLLISKKEYKKYKDCLEINFIEDGREALEQGLSTMTPNGTPLISCGMIEIKLKEGCEDGCFDGGVKLRFPFPEEDCPRCESAGFYNFISNGSWRLNPQKEVTIVEIEGKKFYELIVDCPMKVNCDCEDKTGIGGNNNIVFKWPRKYRLGRINVIYDKPTGNYRFERWKKNKARGGIPCDLVAEEGFVYFQMKDRYGSIIKGEKIPLSEFNHSVRKVCKRNKSKTGFLFFKRYKDKFYVRYKISKKQLKQLKSGRN